MPANAGNPNSSQSFLLNIGGTMSSHNVEGMQNGQHMSRYDEYCIRELAFDLGVDPNALKAKLKGVWSSQQEDDSRGNKIDPSL